MIEKCKAPDPGPFRPDPLAQLEAMLREGWAIDVSRHSCEYPWRLHARRRPWKHEIVHGPTLAAAIAALAEKVGGGS